MMFLAERERLQSVIPHSFIDIQHIGSTAVPMIEAKPIIDMLAGVKSMAVAESLASPLYGSGYITSTEFNDSLIDRKWFMRHAYGHRTHHLHVVVHASKTWFEHIRFRDVLRTNPEIARRYSELKALLAKRYATDREAYTEAKAEFVREVVAK